MAEITAEMVRDLREATNVGMMECKRALVEANGDKEKAIRILRERGMAIAAKKASRAANQGQIGSAILQDGKVGTLVEVNCETDFVAKNANFQQFVRQIAARAADVSGDLAEACKDEVTAKITEIGENIVVRRSAKYTVQGEGLIVSYIHLGGKVGVLLELGCTRAETPQASAFKGLAKDITLHIAASSPRAVDRTSVPAEVIASEREIYAKQMQGKPAQIVDKIVDGKMNKFYQQVCLVDQGFVKNPDQSITQLMQEKGKELSDTVTIRRFTRFQVGE